jgi:hypothetical protein
MPTRKQRRKAQKSRRHDLEYVYVDEEGNEVDVDPEDLKPAKRGTASADRSAAAGNTTAKRRNGKTPAGRGSQRPLRVPPEPSWPRAAKRAAMLGVFFVLVFGFVLRGKHSNPVGAVGIGVVYAIAFIPLQYFIDRTVYRAYLRRQATRKN